MKTYTISNDKGGVCKTTTAINLAAGLGQEGKRILLIDLDSQANCTSVMVGHKDSPLTIYDLLKDYRRSQVQIREVIVATGESNVEIIPSSHQMKSAEIELVNVVNAQQLLRKRVEEIRQLACYDYIIIDSPPNATLVKLMGLFSADKVIVPVVPSDFSLEGIEELLDDLALVADSLDQPIDVGFLLCRIDRTNMTKYIRDNLRETFGDYVYGSEIPNNTTVRDAQLNKRSVLRHAPKSSGAVGYFDFVKEVLDE